MSDGAGTECNNCGGWIHLHYAIIDGVKTLTGKCPNCGLYTDVLPEDKDVGRKHMAYDDYPGKGEVIVEIRRPAQPVRGCRYETVREATKFIQTIPVIPGGSVSIYSVSGVGCESRTVRWPARESDYEDRRQGKIDTYSALVSEFKHSLDYDKPITPETLRQWEEESDQIKGRYGSSVRCELGMWASILSDMLGRGMSYEESAKTIIARLTRDMEGELLLQRELRA